MAYSPSRGRLAGRSFETRGAYRAALALAKAAEGRRSATSSRQDRPSYSPVRGPLQGVIFQTRQQYRNALAERLGFRNAYEQRKMMTASDAARLLVTKARQRNVPVTKQLMERLAKGRASGKYGHITGEWLDNLVDHEEEGHPPEWYH